jgi:methylated-DNA-[protein]-cysteine S-methyltransferase
VRERVTRYGYGVDGWGRGELWVAGGRLLAHDLDLYPSAAAAAGHDDGPAAQSDPPSGGAGSPSGTLSRDASQLGHDFVPTLLQRVHRYFAGEPVRFDDVELELGWATPFGVELARALRSVPWGEVVTYGELAALAGRPGAARAAGTFCAHNRFALVLPCHRVVAAGGIGGYGATGVAVKRRLLELEGVAL